jgi:hypothetical protein
MKRRWYQIHLSTAIVMIFVAGGLLWGNLAISVTKDPLYELFKGNEDDLRDHRIVEAGWPMRYRRQHMEMLPNSENISIQEINVRFQEVNPGTTTNVSFVKGVGVGVSLAPLIMYDVLAIDVAVGLAILSAVAIAAETLLRRREARKP